MTTIDDRYKDALIEEHASYVRAKRTKDANHVAAVLKEQYGHDVAESGAEKDEEPQRAPERADAEKAPENTADPKPRRAARAKTASDDKAGN
jgi:hypothetical protein